MSEDQDRESKTEEPTEKRLTDALEKGNVPVAREATLFGSMAGILISILLLIPSLAIVLSSIMKDILQATGSIRLEDRQAAVAYLVPLLLKVTVALAPTVAVVATGSIIASLAQNVPSMATHRVKPQASRISPLAGWIRLFGSAGWFEFAKSVVKLVAVSALLWFLFLRDMPRMVATLTMDPVLQLKLLREIAADILYSLVILALALALTDLVWSRFRWKRDLRMTRQETKEEMKEAEGDPLMKARIRTIGRQRASRRMLEKLPAASMVITNPTHYAVALRYVREEGGAPVVVAKGVEHMALRIREIAAEHDIPMVENRPLARSLFDQVEIDSQIPPEFYRIVAEIIHYLHSTGRYPRKPT